MANAPIFAGQRATAALIASLAPQSVLKQLDQSLASNTTLQNDTELVLPVAANAQYIFVSFINFEGATQGNGDLKILWSLPSGGHLHYTVPFYLLASIGGGNNTYPPSLVGSSPGSFGSNGAGVQVGLTLLGTLFMGNTGGNLQLQWAQQTSSATPTIVHGQSMVALWRTS